MRRALLLLGLAAATALVACAPSEPLPPAGPTATVIDGVRVVETPAPVWSAGDEWYLSREPLLTIGVDVGQAHEMFTNPGALRLRDGRFVIADRGTNELRYFGADGKFLYTRGGVGEGPGKFGGIGEVWERPDGGLVVDDFRLRRMTALDSEGGFERTFTMQPHGMDYTSPRPVAMLADGSFLAQASKRPFPRVPQGQIEWQMMGLFHYAADGTAPHHILDAPYMERSGGESGLVFYSRGYVVSDPEGRIFHSDGRSFEISVYDLQGNLQERFRRAGELIPVTEADKEVWLTKSRQNIAEHGGDPNAEARIGHVTYAEYMPTVAGATRDEFGNLWVRRYLGVKYSWAIYYEAHQRFEPEESIWDLFASDGVWLGPIALPVDRYPLQIGPDWVLMGGESNAGVQQIFLYELIKP